MIGIIGCSLHSAHSTMHGCIDTLNRAHSTMHRAPLTTHHAPLTAPLNHATAHTQPCMDASTRHLLLQEGPGIALCTISLTSVSGRTGFAYFLTALATLPPLVK
eukprot:1159601-Pelagomonas_calceolata.AAC.5